jgi:hypothetical protein
MAITSPHDPRCLPLIAPPDFQSLFPRKLRVRFFQSMTNAEKEEGRKQGAAVLNRRAPQGAPPK